MFDSATLLAFFTLLLGLFFGIAIGNNTDYQYKKIYCPKYTQKLTNIYNVWINHLMIRLNLS